MARERWPVTRQSAKIRDMSETTEPRTRVFFALVPPPPLQQALGDLARACARRAHGRPVPAGNIHLTLAFIGAWPIARLPVLFDAGRTLVGESMRIALDVQGGFRRAGVAWIAPSKPPPALPQLAGDLCTALSRAGVAPEARPFHPHLTLARHCRGPFASDPTGPFAWDVDGVTLMQSDTRADGARYTGLAQWPLRAARQT